MDDCNDNINELKDLVRKWVPDEEAYAEQKITFLSQVNSSSVVTEGLKLLSMLIEIDSCSKHGCVFNRNKTVNQILKDHKILGPTLPDVVPDGYRISGSTIILLETFVRTSQESFEQKYRHDFDKLLQLTKDLQKCGLMLVPVIDGRSNYYVDRFPDWVVERIRWLLLRLMNRVKESGEKIEELEYSRLICSLSSMENQNLGLESLRVLKEEGLDYKTKLMEAIKDGVRGDLTTSECRIGIAKLYDQFCLLRESGVYQDVYKPTSRDDLIRWLKCHKLNLAVNNGSAPFIEDKPCGFCQNHMLKVLAELIKTRRMSHQFHFTRDEELSKHKKLLSDCNKIKGLKVLNTRRHTLLSLDIMILNSLINLLKSGVETTQFLVNDHFKSVNDRLLSVDLIINRLGKKLLKQPNWLSFVRSKLEKRLKVYDLDHTGVWLSEVDYEFWYTFKFERSASAKCEKPTIRYKKVNSEKCYQTEFGSDLISSDDLFIEYLNALSTLSLGMVNSMKTSSAAKLVINNEKDFYGTVKCDECYFQDLDSSFKSILLYQKTGERSRCYSLMHRDEEHTSVYKNGQSFYADPKRFFLPIMSTSVILEMSKEMLSWLDWLTSEEISIVKSKLYTLIINVLTVPSKRVQIYLQGFRYFIMAFVNEFHFERLDKKLSVLPLTTAESHIFMLMDDIVVCLLEEALEENMAKIFKFILNLSYLCHFITKETPDRLTD
ncbi:RNA-dependent RNA polymerase, partial [Big brushy tank virus]